MKYYLIVGEASGDLHASHLMAALKEEDPEAEFRFFGGDLMAAVGGTMVKHYKELAYMGFIPVLLHLPTIFANMKRCKEDIVAWSPDVVILVDYPGFNLDIAKFVHAKTKIPVYYYISPKIWAWKEYRIKNIKRDVDELFSILPFEVGFFKGHRYPIHYVGNPGTSAKANRDYFQRLKDAHTTKASSHFVVGLDGEIVQCIPSTEISYASNERNKDTLSIECCHPDETGKFNEATYQSMVNLTGWLCARFGLDSQDVIRHYDVTGKICPKYFVEHEDAWEQFKSDVQTKAEEIKKMNH